MATQKTSLDQLETILDNWKYSWYGNNVTIQVSLNNKNEPVITLHNDNCHNDQGEPYEETTTITLHDLSPEQIEIHTTEPQTAYNIPYEDFLSPRVETVNTTIYLELHGTETHGCPCCGDPFDWITQPLLTLWGVKHPEEHALTVKIDHSPITFEEDDE